MSITIDTLSQQKLKVSHAAHFLTSFQRQNIGIQAIRGSAPIAHVAERYGVSRKFVYHKKRRLSRVFLKPLKNRLLTTKFFFIFRLQNNGSGK